MCKYAVIVILFLLPIISNGQIYNYTPLRYFDIESNPSALPLIDVEETVSFSSVYSFSNTKKFNQNTLSVSKNVPSIFSGIGISAGNTVMGDSIQYRYGSLGGGYRSVLFNKVYVQVGFSSKLLYVNAPEGMIDYYDFVPSPSGTNKAQEINSNFNYSFSFSTFKARAFLSCSWLNDNLLDNTTNAFPEYFVLQAGNLLSLTRRKNAELSYMYLRKKTSLRSDNHYVTFKWSNAITRKFSIIYGARIGLLDNQFLHLTPTFSYFRNNLVITFYQDIFPEKSKGNQYFPSTTQINVTFNPWRLTNRRK